MRRVLLLLILLAAAATASPAAIDPFYRNRMESGVRAFEQSNWEAAQRQLRIACFGHLDEPVELAGGLVRLAIAEARLGDEDSFRRITSRLVEIEERFGAYSAARLPAALVGQFEELAARLISADSLRGIRGFDSVVERAERQRLAQLPPDRRRTELEARLAAEPARPDWLIELARLELAERRPRPALAWLDRLPAEAAATPPATCLRQQAASEVGDCAGADLTRPFCSDVPPGVVEFRLQCLVDANEWERAAALLGGLEPEIRSRRRMARLERRVRKNFDGVIPTGPPPGGGAIATAAPAGGETGPPAGGTLATPSAAAQSPPAAPDPGQLESLRRRLDTAAGADQLAALRTDAEALADTHPDSRPARLLAAEVAYLQSDWPAVVSHFRLAGPLGPGEAQLGFYQAVALYETGDAAGAAAILRPVLPRLQRGPFVDSYVDRILGGGS